MSSLLFVCLFFIFHSLYVGPSCVNTRGSGRGRFAEPNSASRANNVEKAVGWAGCGVRALAAVPRRAQVGVLLGLLVLLVVCVWVLVCLFPMRKEVRWRFWGGGGKGVGGRVRCEAGRSCTRGTYR